MIALADRQPPFHLEAERGMLGGCMLFNQAIDECVDLVAEGDLWRDAHAKVWRAIVALRARGTEVDAVTVADWLIKAGLYADLGGDAMLAEVCNSVPHGANAVYYAGIIRDCSDIRKLIALHEKGLGDCYANQSPSADLICDAEEAIFALSDIAAVGATIDAEPLIAETMGRLELRREGSFVGVTTGFDDLDCMVRGLCPANLVIIAGRPSQGKTAFGLEVMRRVSIQGRRVLFVSLEMSRMELGDRLLSMQSGVPGELVYKPWMLKSDQEHRIYLAADSLAKLPFRIDDTPGRTIAQIAANARRARHRVGLDLLIIDYMSLIDGRRQRGESRQDEVARISKGLKQLARELSVPVVCLCQLNRQNELRDEKRPRLSDLRESGQIEQDADAVLMIHRPEYYDLNDRPGEADLIVAKNRNGATGTVRLAFNRWCTQFDSYAAPVLVEDPAF